MIKLKTNLLDLRFPGSFLEMFFDQRALSSCYAAPDTRDGDGERHQIFVERAGRLVKRSAKMARFTRGRDADEQFLG